MSIKLTLIRGLPGSGKSTLAKTYSCNHYEADMYFIQSDGTYLYQAEKIGDAHQWCKAMTERSLAAKQSVVVSNTFVRRWEIAPYQKLARQYGATFEVIECTSQYGNIHGVDPQTIATMKKRWQQWQNAQR
ncbi:ATP-binding protein [Vibrio atypicus]|uniref:ATP-binding protein n=1 Tax=Vibrio atypicus TaxID=558271 RepID=UPI00373596BC